MSLDAMHEARRSSYLQKEAAKFTHPSLECFSEAIRSVGRSFVFRLLTALRPST
jgi:hypothetical protein